NPAPAPYSTFVRKQCDDFTEWYLAVQKMRIHNHLRYSATQRNNAQNAVSQIGRIRTRAGTSVPVVVALLPDENQVNQALQARIVPADKMSEYDFKMPQSMLANMLSEIGAPTIDVLPAVLADRRCLYMNDTHWTPEGHEIAASAIFKELTPFLRGWK